MKLNLIIFLILTSLGAVGFLYFSTMNMQFEAILSLTVEFTSLYFYIKERNNEE